MKIKIYDTTLREGMQSVGTSFSLGDKVQLAKLLDDLGVEFIEGGFPGGSPKDAAFYEKMREIKLKNAKLVAFGPTVKPGLLTEDDPMIKALSDAGTEYVTIFGKTCKNQVTEVLGVSPEDNIDMIKKTVSFFVKTGKKVFFDAEHFFTGFGYDKEYPMKCIKAAVDEGAFAIVLCDTNGGNMPDAVSEAVNYVKNVFADDITIGIHTHNDCGTADYSSILAALNGATLVQVTLNGWGERCGNANLFTVVPNLELKFGADCLPDLSKLFDAAHKAAEIANVKLSEYSPYVGKNAFSHKAGVHIDAVMKNTNTYEHTPPESVGNSRNLILSEQSGKAAVLAKLSKLLPEIGVSPGKASYIAEKIKELELKGYSFDYCDASFKMLVKQILHIKKKWFELNNYKVVTLNKSETGVPTASAIVDVTVDGKEEVTAANGIGPVDALDGALRKALMRFYPEVEKMWLVDYKVRVLESKQATASVVRVIIESSNGKDTWTTVGVSGDIIQASFNALVDSYEYMLDKNNTKI